MRRAGLAYAQYSFKSFFQLQKPRHVSESARLKDLAVHFDGVDVKAQHALLGLVGAAEARERPPPLDETLEVLRRHNSSLLRLEGQCVYGKVRNSSFRPAHRL